MPELLSASEQLAGEVYDRLSVLLHPDPDREDVPIALDYGNQVTVHRASCEIDNMITAQINGDEADIAASSYEAFDGRRRYCMFVLLKSGVVYDSNSKRDIPQEALDLTGRLFTRFTCADDALAS